MNLNKKIGVAIAALSFIGVAINVVMLFISTEGIDARLINLAYCGICLILSVASLLCSDYLAMSIQLCSICVGAFLCFNTQGSYMYGSIILSLGVVMAYSNGLFNTLPKIKAMLAIIISWVFIAIACPEPFPQSAIIASGHTVFIVIFLYVLHTILRDKIASEKIVEKRMIDAVDEAEHLLSEAMDIIKETNKKMREGGSNGCK